MAISKQVLDQFLGDRDPNEVLSKDGLLDDLKKALAERILNSELDEHLEKEHGSGKTARRNGTSPKTVQTERAKEPLDIPRDRAGTFDPQLIARYQRRFPAFDEKIISMYARGMTVREIQGHLEDIYGVDASPALISRITDTVMDAVKEWQARPFEARHPLIFFDAIRVKIRDEGFVRNKAVYIALGIQPDGTNEVLGIGIEQSEGARFWMRVMTELKNRGIADILIAVVDGLKGFPDAITAVFPKTVVQTCIVHLIRAVSRAVDEKAALDALSAFEDSEWGRKDSPIAQSWCRALENVIPFFAFPEAVRRIIYTTNAIEALNSKRRRAVRTRGHFQNDEAALKLLYLALSNAAEDWKRPPREWVEAKNQFAILFEERFQSV